MSASRPERSAELRELIQAHGADPDDPRLGGDEASVRETLALSRQLGISLRPKPSPEERAEVLFSPEAPAMLQAIAAAKVPGRGLHASTADAVMGAIYGGRDAQKLLQVLRVGHAPAEALLDALDRVLATGDRARLQGFAREVQKALEREQPGGPTA